MVNNVNLFAQPIRREQQATTPAVSREPSFSVKTNPFKPQQGPSFGSTTPLAMKYGSPKLDTATVAGAQEKHSVGLSPMREGALGHNAIYNGSGRTGGKLNFFA